MFILKKTRSPKWYYGYESGSTKQQRHMKHQLKAYVFQVVDSESSEEMKQLLRVVAITQSTPFAIISYRRARETGRFGVFPKRKRKKKATAAALGVNNAFLSQPSSEVQWALAGADAKENTSLNSHHSGTRPHLSVLSLAQNTTSSVLAANAVLAEQIAWEIQHSRELKQMRQLMVVCFFVSQLQMDDLSFCNGLDTLEKLIQKYTTWLLALPTRQQHAAERMATYTERISLQMFQSSHVRSADCKANETSSADSAARANSVVLSTCVEIVGMFLFVPTYRQQIQKFFRDKATREVVFSKRKLQESFLELSSCLCEELDTFLSHKYGTTTPTDSKANRTTSEQKQKKAGAASFVDSHLDEFVNDIVALIFQNEKFRTLRTRTRELLCMWGFSEPNAAFRVFVAQMREAHVNSQRAARPTDHVETGFSLPWTGIWFLDMKTTRVRWLSSLESTFAGFHFSLLTLLRRINEFACLKIIQKSNESFSVQSETSFLPGKELTQLVLDGKVRVFRLFPNGIATLSLLAAVGSGDGAGGVLYGEYAGVFDPQKKLLQIEFYGRKAFKEEEKGNASSSEEANERKCQRLRAGCRTN